MEDVNLEKILEQKNLEAVYDYDEDEGVCIVRDKNSGLYGTVNEKGEILIDTTYDFIDYFEYGGFSIAIKEPNGKQGIINKKGEEIIPYIYDEIMRFIDGLVIANKNGIYGCIDMDGKVLFPFTVSAESFFDLSELYSLADGRSLNKISERNFNKETAPLFLFIVERNIRAGVEEVIKGKKISQQTRDILEEKIQEKIKQAQKMIDDKIKQNTIQKDIDASVLEEIDNIII